MSRSLNIMSTLAVEVAFKRFLLPTWRAVGGEVEVDWDPTAVLMRRISSGQRADALVMIDASMRELAAEGIVRADTMTPIARAGFGLGVRAGARHPDISTPDRFRNALAAACSIAYSRTGASGLYFAELIQRLGIADTVNAKAVVIPAGFTAQRLLTGECDLAVQQISELMSVEGVEVVGPFPDEFQVATDFSVAIFTEAKAPDLAARFIAHLSTSQAAEAYHNGGLKPRLSLQAASPQDIS